jgi:DNA-binding CsgD family transcriptional regulator
MAKEVIGRDEELGAIEAFLAAAEQGPAALVLSGEPGLGKTILWEAGIGRAAERSYRVLTCRGVEAEASFAFAGLSELLTGVLEEAAPALAPPRRRALEVALLLAEPDEIAPETLVIGLAVLDVLHDLAQRGPIVVAVDDVQWLDPSSAAVLQVALRRLREERVGLLATVREAPGAHPSELERSVPEERLTRLPLAPLSLGALHHLLRERLGIELRRPELVRLQVESGGNPFFALELARHRATREAGEPLPVPSSLGTLLGDRLTALPRATLDLLVTAAAAGRPTVELICAAHGDARAAREALEPALREGVIDLDGTRVRFGHPLLASVCLGQAPSWQRRDAHAALAGVVADLEERARHLALAAEHPDAGVASELDAAAEQAASRGAPATAAELCELAAGLTEDDPAHARGRRLRAARLHHLAGDTRRAETMLADLLLEVPPGSERADVLFTLAAMLTGDQATMIERCNEALREAGDDDRRAANVLAFRAWVHILDDAHASLADARAALAKAERAGDEALLATVIGRTGQAEAWTVDITPGLLQRGVEIEKRLGLLVDYRSSPTLYQIRLQLHRGELEEPRKALEELEAGSVARGDENARTLILWYLSQLEWLAGRWPLALEYASAAHELGRQVSPHYRSAWTGRVKAIVEGDLGLVAEARASAEEGLAHTRATSNELFAVLCEAALGRLELALGNYAVAGAHLRELPGRLSSRGWNDPFQPVWGDAIETLVALGELEQARAYLEQFEKNARRLGSPLVLEALHRCGGLLSAAEGDRQAGIAELEHALAVQPQAPWPFERARTLLSLGVVRRQAQQKRSARDTLEQALAILDDLPAPLWAEKARAELRRISGRQPSSDGLTETEARVAALAALGSTNKQIAAELFMGVSTVEAHLSRVYRKLGIRSRSGLGPRLAIQRDEAAQT